MICVIFLQSATADADEMAAITAFDARLRAEGQALAIAASMHGNRRVEENIS